jgi:hypothetical protein
MRCYCLHKNPPGGFYVVVTFRSCICDRARRNCLWKRLLCAVTLADADAGDAQLGNSRQHSKRGLDSGQSSLQS